MAIKREDAHRLGEERARLVKQWLESSLRFSMDLLIYDADSDTNLSFSDLKLDQLVGAAEAFDLFGACRKEDQTVGRRILVECKGYTTASTVDKNHKAYREFLAVCYSGMKYHFNRNDGDLPSRDFMYVTYHPFSIGEHENFLSFEYVLAAIEGHPDRVPVGEIDADVVRALCDRLWFSIADHRLCDMLMSAPLVRVMRHAVLKELGK